MHLYYICNINNINNNNNIYTRKCNNWEYQSFEMWVMSCSYHLLSSLTIMSYKIHNTMSYIYY